MKLFGRDLSKPLNPTTSTGRIAMLKNTMDLVPKPVFQKMLSTSILPSMFSDYIKKSRKEGKQVTSSQIVAKFHENPELVELVKLSEISHETLERLANEAIKKSH